jgi:hypothetical protein
MRKLWWISREAMNMEGVPSFTVVKKGWRSQDCRGEGGGGRRQEEGGREEGEGGGEEEEGGGG